MYMKGQLCYLRKNHTSILGSDQGPLSELSRLRCDFSLYNVLLRLPVTILTIDQRQWTPSVGTEPPSL
jgi:hypothetical protein